MATLQSLQLVLQLGELLGVDAARVQHRPVAVLALPNRVDLALELRHLGLDVLHREVHRRKAVVGVAVFGGDLVVALLLGEVAGPVLETTKFGVELGQFDQ